MTLVSLSKMFKWYSFLMMGHHQLLLGRFMHQKAFSINNYNAKQWDNQYKIPNQWLDSFRISTDGKVSWIGVAVVSWLLQDGEVTIPQQQPVCLMLSWCSVESLPKLSWFKMLKAKAETETKMNRDWKSRCEWNYELNCSSNQMTSQLKSAFFW